VRFDEIRVTTSSLGTVTILRDADQSFAHAKILATFTGTSLRSDTLNFYRAAFAGDKSWVRIQNNATHRRPP
jgi:hypothetical protein